MTPIAESLAGSSGGQRRFIKQLILLTDNPPPTPLRFNSCQALRSSCLFVFWERNYFAIASSLKKKTPNPPDSENLRQKPESCWWSWHSTRHWHCGRLFLITILTSPAAASIQGYVVLCVLLFGFMYYLLRRKPHVRPFPSACHPFCTPGLVTLMATTCITAHRPEDLLGTHKCCLPSSGMHAQGISSLNLYLTYHTHNLLCAAPHSNTQQRCSLPRVRTEVWASNPHPIFFLQILTVPFDTTHWLFNTCRLRPQCLLSIW